MTETNTTMTLETALESGLVVFKKDVKAIIDEENIKLRASLKEELKKEIAKESQQDIVNNRMKSASQFMDGTGITNKKFAEKLLSWNVGKKYLSCLRDEHIKLSHKDVWSFIRKNYQEPKRR